MKSLQAYNAEVLRSHMGESIQGMYIAMIIAVLHDVAHVCNRSDTETQRDATEVTKRCINEGTPFLTKTLPSLGKAIDFALATNTVLSTTGFKLRKGTKIPLFMGDVFIQVFSSDGRERSDASPQAVEALRQVAYMFYKLNLPFTEAQEDEVINLFKETDKNLPKEEDLVQTRDQKQILRIARALISRVLAFVDPFNKDNLFPKHGPGAVATGEKPWEKPVFKVYYRRLAEKYPYETFFHYNATHFCDDLQGYLNLREMEAGTAKVVLVPKDSRGPRLISCEPPEYQWIQQAQMRLMVNTIEQHPLTKGYVNFTDQTVNGTLALQGSLDGSWVTLDMKEASDRVSLALVKALFPHTWFEALNASRTDGTRLPNGEVVQLNKFAPMGSAVCFPVESLIFWALSVSASIHVSGKSHGSVAAGRAVYVYGDDIVCSREDYPAIQQHLSSFGLLFNDQKCCTGDSFRESCGVDAYKGVVVTPLRVKAVWSSSLPGSDYLSWVALHNAANNRGLFALCDVLAKAIQRVRLTPYTDSPESECIALCDCRKMAMHENRRIGVKTRFNRELHVVQARSWVARVRSKRADTPGWCEMLRVASASPPSSKEAVDEVDIKSYLKSRALAPYSTHPGKPGQLDWSRWVPELYVRAYQYSVPRRILLKRGWARVN